MTIVIPFLSFNPRLDAARAGVSQGRVRVRKDYEISLYARLNSIYFNFHVGVSSFVLMITVCGI